MGFVDTGVATAALEWFVLHPTAFILFYVVWTLLGLPGTPVTLAAGWMYSPPMFAALLVIVGASTGSIIAFLLTRWVMRDYMQRRLGRLESRWRNVLPAVERNGWMLVFVLRLLPIAPFSLLNYLLGLTSIKASEYFVASLLGMIPCTVAYVYVGAAASDLPSLLSLLGIGPPSDSSSAGDTLATQRSAMIFLVILCLTIVVLWAATSYARRAFSRLAVTVTPSDVEALPMEDLVTENSELDRKDEKSV